MINLRTLASLVKAKTAPKVVTSSVEELDAEKLTRRAALRRIGMAGGMAVLGVLSIDDLARVSAKKLEQHELTRGIAEEFKNAGVAFAQEEDGEETYQADCRTRAARYRRYCKEGAYERCGRNTLSPCYVNASRQCDAEADRRRDAC